MTPLKSKKAILACAKRILDREGTAEGTWAGKDHYDLAYSVVHILKPKRKRK